MKTRFLMLEALCAAALTAAVSVGCTGLEPYTVDAPDDLADKIAEYEREKSEGQSDDYTEITITTPIVGAEDNSSGWWSEFSQYFAVPSGKKLFIEFENFGTGVNNWNNWNVCVSTPYERDAEGYSEYFVLRSDAYGWGNGDYNASVIEFDYGGGEVNWDEFREKMQGAYVTLSLDHARAGAAYLEVHSVAADGFDIVEKYNQSVSATEDVNVFLIADGSHFNIKKAYLVPSEIAEIPDFDAESITVTGYPVTVPLGNEDYWGNTMATVTFEDGFTTTVAKEDLTITEPDMTTLGIKTVAFTYNLTKLGKPGKAVVGYYNFEVTDLASIAVTKAPLTSTYYVYDKAVPFFTEGIEITGTKGDGSTVVLDNSALTFGEVQPVAGTQDIEIAFSGISTTFPVNVKMGIEGIGEPDFSNGWWSTFLSADKPVAAGESVTVHLFVYSDNLANWHSPCTILRKADLSEYGVVRMDSFGWGAGYDGNPNLVVESDWNFDIFAANQNMSAVSITVTNNGDNTADVRYNVTYANGETHFQQYSGITVDSADLQMGIVTEESYLIVLESAAVDAKLTGIEASAEAYRIGGAKGLTLSAEGLKVNALYSDGSKLPLKKDQVTVAFAAEKVFYDCAPGTYNNVATVSYTDPVGTEFTAPVTLTVKASDQAAQSGMVGAQDFTNAWWTTFSNNWNVPAGTMQAVSMTVGSDNLLNFHSPCVILRKADMTEYCVVRMDHFGWGTSFDAGTVPSSNWNWDTFAGNIDGSKVDVTVANDGNGFASIRYHVVYTNGEEHFQFYDNIAVDSSDVTFAFVTEESYLIFD